MQAQAGDSARPGFIIGTGYESQAAAFRPNRFDLDQEKPLGQAGCRSLRPLHEYEAIGRRYEIVEPDRREVGLVPETVEVEVIKAPDSRSGSNLVLINK